MKSFFLNNKFCQDKLLSFHLKGQKNPSRTVGISTEFKTSARNSEECLKKFAEFPAEFYKLWRLWR